MPGHKKRYCVHGHDTWECGRRNAGGGCRECKRVLNRIQRCRANMSFEEIEDVRADARARYARSGWKTQMLTRDGIRATDLLNQLADVTRQLEELNA